ncbi:hypothetical protein GGI00_004432, partial [Coemansia sp. RSA 2681]
GHGNRYARSPSPYRGGRRARDRRSPVRSRSPYGGRRYGGGGGPRYQNRSPSPRHGGGYRGGRYARSRSFSRSRRLTLGRAAVRMSTCGKAMPAPRLAGPFVARSLHLTRHVQAIPGFDMNNPTLKKIQSSPRVMAAMGSAMQLLQSKGFIDPADTKPPSFMKLMQMMGDADVKQAFMEVQKLLREEGISFSPTDLSAFMSGGMAPNSGDSNTKDGEKDGLFKRIASSIKPRS